MALAMIIGMLPVTDQYTYADGNEAAVTDSSGKTTEYATFAAALTAAAASKGSTLKVLQNITITTMQKITNGKFSIDLNGKTVTCALTSEQDYGIWIENAYVTICDSASGGMIKGVSNIRYATVYLCTSAIVNLNGGTIAADGEVYSYDGTITISGGTFQGGGSCVNVYSATVNISGGSFKCKDSDCIYIYEGTLNISGGTFELDEDARYKLVNSNSAKVL